MGIRSVTLGTADDIFSQSEYLFYFILFYFNFRILYDSNLILSSKKKPAKMFTYIFWFNTFRHIRMYPWNSKSSNGGDSLQLPSSPACPSNKSDGQLKHEHICCFIRHDWYIAVWHELGSNFWDQVRGRKYNSWPEYFCSDESHSGYQDCKLWHLCSCQHFHVRYCIEIIIT